MRAIPMTCTEQEICDSDFDNVEVGDFSIMTDARTVWISEQPCGHDRKQHFEIDREIFNKLIRWYTEGVVPKEDKRKPEHSR